MVSNFLKATIYGFNQYFYTYFYNFRAHRAPRINLTAGRVRFYLLTLLTSAADVRAQCSAHNFLFDIDGNLRQIISDTTAVVWEFSTVLMCLTGNDQQIEAYICRNEILAIPIWNCLLWQNKEAHSNSAILTTLFRRTVVVLV